MAQPFPSIDKSEFPGKVAVVTGGASGIGRAAALRLAAGAYGGSAEDRLARSDPSPAQRFGGVMGW